MELGAISRSDVSSEGTRPPAAQAPSGSSPQSDPCTDARSSHSGLCLLFLPTPPGPSQWPRVLAPLHCLPRSAAPAVGCLVLFHSQVSFSPPPSKKGIWQQNRKQLLRTGGETPSFLRHPRPLRPHQQHPPPSGFSAKIVLRGETVLPGELGLRLWRNDEQRCDAGKRRTDVTLGLPGERLGGKRGRDLIREMLVSGELQG